MYSITCIYPLRISCSNLQPNIRSGRRRETLGEPPGSAEYQTRNSLRVNRDSLALTRLASKGASNIGVLLHSGGPGTLRLTLSWVPEVEGKSWRIPSTIHITTSPTFSLLQTLHNSTQCIHGFEVFISLFTEYVLSQFTSSERRISRGIHQWQECDHNSKSLLGILYNRLLLNAVPTFYIAWINAATKEK